MISCMSGEETVVFSCISHSSSVFRRFRAAERLDHEKQCHVKLSVHLAKPRLIHIIMVP